MRITIGSADVWDLAAARAEATRLKLLLDQGIDPREERAARIEAVKAKATQAARKEMTVGSAWDAYVESRRAFWGARHYKDHLVHGSPGGQPKKRGDGYTQAGPIAALRDVPLAQLSGTTIARWLSEESKRRPTVAALSYRLLRGFIRWAEDSPEFEGIVPSKAYTSRSVKDAVPKVRAKSKDVLQREQIAAWFFGVRSLENLVMSTYLQGLLLTGARREELAALKWSDVDFQWNSLTLHDKVEGDEGRTIPLTNNFRRQLLLLRSGAESREVNARNDSYRNATRLINIQPNWVFASPTSASGRIASPRSAHQRALVAAGLPHITLHGLRRSFATLSGWCEAPAGVVAQIQGHKPSAIAEKHYQRRGVDQLRVWHQRIEDWMLAQTSGSLE